MSALLSLQGISKRFRGLVAVDGVSFSVPEGAIFAVIGPNGAGKTTLFNMIAGALPPDDGTIAFAGERDRPGLRPTRCAGAASPAPSRSCGRFRRLSVEDNVIVGALLHRHDVGAARAHARDAAAAARPATTSATASPRR